MVNVEFKNVCKYYKVGEVSTKALDKASFTIDEGELVTIVGPSGSGKSTCFNILGGMDSALVVLYYVMVKRYLNLLKRSLLIIVKIILVLSFNFII